MRRKTSLKNTKLLTTMKKSSFFSIVAALLLSGMSASAQTIECPDAATAAGADYYLSNPYYFQCTALKDTLAHDENVKANADGLIKLTGDGWSDFHWDGTSRAIFDNINLSAAGDYTLTINYRNSGSLDLIVNDETTNINLDGASPAKLKVSLQEGMNTIKLGKTNAWQGFYSISLEKITKVVTTTITFDKQGGEGGTESVVATQGEAMPEIDVPTRTDWFFNGYFDAAEGGSKYYNVDGSGAKVWDKESETATLYAQWYDGTPVLDLNVECPDKEAAMAPDYYLNNMYLALCTELKPSIVIDDQGRKDFELSDGSIVLLNKDSNLLKLCGDREYVEWHWDDKWGKSSLIFDNIYVSESGNYDIEWTQRNGGTVALYVNGDSIDHFNAPAKGNLTFYRMPLKAGEANTIKIEKVKDWPQTYGIQLHKSSAEVSKTTVTLDMQGGTGGTATVEATMGEAMPEITLPTRDGYVFEGYFTEIEGGDQYYAMDGSSYKAWDKTDKEFTLYAHWNDGGTGGECPTPKQAHSDNWYLNHMYDARCTNLTNTWEKDGGAYIYTNTEGGKVKITANGEWLDFYFADPSSIVFDSIYVSEDGYYDMTWFFRLDYIDGADEAGSASQLYVNDELVDQIVVWKTTGDTEVDQTKYEGLELWADFPNKIVIQKINGWPLTRGIQLSGEGMGIKNAHTASFFVSVADGAMTLNRLSGNSDIAIYSLTGEQVLTAATTEVTYTVSLPQGAYIVKVNGEYAKAVVR